MPSDADAVARRLKLAAAARAPERRRGTPRRRTSRWAALAFLPFVLVPTAVGVDTVLNDPNRPGAGCFEYCSFNRDLGYGALALGVLGLLVVAAIWRRSVAAMALALFVCSLASLLVGIAFFGWFWSGSILAGPLSIGPLVGVTVLVATPTLLLLAALRDEVAAA
jgi:hypothetical protein